MFRLFINISLHEFWTRFLKPFNKLSFCKYMKRNKFSINKYIGENYRLTTRKLEYFTFADAGGNSQSKSIPSNPYSRRKLIDCLQKLIKTINNLYLILYTLISYKNFNSMFVRKKKIDNHFFKQKNIKTLLQKQSSVRNFFKKPYFDIKLSAMLKF